MLVADGPRKTKGPIEPSYEASWARKALSNLSINRKEPSLFPLLCPGFVHKFARQS